MVGVILKKSGEWMRYVTNRILNTVLLSFMATFGWLILGLLIYFDGNAELFDIIGIVGIMFLILLLIFGIMFFIDKELDFFKKKIIINF